MIGLYCVFCMQNIAFIASKHNLEFIAYYKECCQYSNLMKGHQKVLQLNSNLSKLIDSLCFELSVNVPDDNSLSLLEIIEWRKSAQVSQEQFKELYCGWLESKNIYDLFTAKQVETYPKQQLLQFEGPIKTLLNPKEITQFLQTLNNLYNEIYIEKRVKAMGNNPKNQVKNVEEVEQLFSALDTQGLIHLRLNQMFFLTAALIISENKFIPSDFYLFRQPFRKYLLEFSEINGCVSLRTFKNYFLVQKSKPLLVKTLSSILIEVQNLSTFASQSNAKSNGLPNVFRESFQKWKSYPRFKGKEKRIQFLKRIFEQNERIFIFSDEIQSSSVEQELRNKYGNDFINCLEIDSVLIEEFLHILEDTLNKYINIFQKISSAVNKGKSQKTQYINSSIDIGRDVQTSTNKKKLQSSIMESGTKNIPRNSFLKERTPLKKKKNQNEFTASNNYTPSHKYQSRTPTHKNRSQINGVHKQFGSAEKHVNATGLGKTVRHTTPTKSTLSFLTEAPKTYRAAQKRGLTQNNIYDKLFFFRNKRVQSYEIVMKRLKNK